MVKQRIKVERVKKEWEKNFAAFLSWPRKYINFPEQMNLVSSYYVAAIKHFNCPLGGMKGDETIFDIVMERKSTVKGNFLVLTDFSARGKLAWLQWIILTHLHILYHCKDLNIKDFNGAQNVNMNSCYRYIIGNIKVTIKKNLLYFSYPFPLPTPPKPLRLWFLHRWILPNSKE